MALLLFHKYFGGFPIEHDPDRAILIRAVQRNAILLKQRERFLMRVAVVVVCAGGDHCDLG